jgi:hypothetical protein
MKMSCLFPCTRWSCVVASSMLMLSMAMVACQQTSQESLFRESVEYRSSGKQVFMFVPLDGCGTCIENSSTFINNHLTKNEYITAYVYSLYKKKYLQFDSAVVNSRRLIFDKEDKILSVLKVEQKPRVVFMQDGKIISNYVYDNETDAEVFNKILNFQ